MTQPLNMRFSISLLKNFLCHFISISNQNIAAFCLRRQDCFLFVFIVRFSHVIMSNGRNIPGKHCTLHMDTALHYCSTAQCPGAAVTRSRMLRHRVMLPVYPSSCVELSGLLQRTLSGTCSLILHWLQQLHCRTCSTAVTPCCSVSNWCTLTLSTLALQWALASVSTFKPTTDCKLDKVF